MLDITSQIVPTLIAGATLVGKEWANQAIRDSYSGLKSLVVNLFGAPADAAIEKIQSNPADADAPKALIEYMSAHPPVDLARLEASIATLHQAILTAKSEMGRLDPEVEVVFEDIARLQAGNIASKGHASARVVLSRIENVVVGDIVLESKPGK